MDNKEEKAEEGSCCSSDKECGSGCGCGSGGGKRRCCSGKTALILVLMLLSGLVGYGVGKCHMGGCGSRMANCPVTGAPAPAPAVK